MQQGYHALATLVLGLLLAAHTLTHFGKCYSQEENLRCAGVPGAPDNVEQCGGRAGFEKHISGADIVNHFGTLARAELCAHTGRQGSLLLGWVEETTHNNTSPTAAAMSRSIIPSTTMLAGSATAPKRALLQQGQPSLAPSPPPRPYPPSSIKATPRPPAPPPGPPTAQPGLVLRLNIACSTQHRQDLYSRVVKIVTCCVTPADSLLTSHFKVNFWNLSFTDLITHQVRLCR
jgi:hypothetical protein